MAEKLVIDFETVASPKKKSWVEQYEERINKLRSEIALQNHI
ncbi:hypothetical protein WAZ07_11765 [Bacillus sp. FJAT-51639]|uniref:3'-5' exonuclease n=1 Tax=Bacillus bruguierae TaxID=3127667 RepID=A0ABU8FH26_9BACI